MERNDSRERQKRMTEWNGRVGEASYIKPHGKNNKIHTHTHTHTKTTAEVPQKSRE